MRQILLILALSVFIVGCSAVPTGRVTAGSDEPTCPLGAEFRNSELSCYEFGADAISLHLYALDESIMGAKVVMHGEKEFNESFRNERYKPYLRVSFDQIKKKVGRLDYVTVYPIVVVGSEPIVCDNPLKIELDFC